MKRRIFATVLALCVCMAAVPTAYAWQVPQTEVSVVERTEKAASGTEIPTPQEAYAAMIALKEQNGYREGTTWTNDTPYSLSKSYDWHGGTLPGNVRGGVGCVAFAFILSDTAFGSLPARMLGTGEFRFSDVKSGDILRVDGGAHTVIVLQAGDTGVVIAEGNYNKSVHWGRTMTKAEVEAANHLITRYPAGYIPPTDPSANEPVAGGTGTLAGGLSWTLTKGGTLTISGSGAMPDFDAPGDQLWNAYADKILKIVVKDGITKVGSCAFRGSGALSVTIPNGVREIGSNAFRETAIIAVTIPGSVRSIGDSAFRSCANLSTATVPEGVETIGGNAFRGCTELDAIALPASIVSVGAAAFTS